MDIKTVRFDILTRTDNGKFRPTYFGFDFELSKRRGERKREREREKDEIKRITTLDFHRAIGDSYLNHIP